VCNAWGDTVLEHFSYNTFTTKINLIDAASVILQLLGTINAPIMQFNTQKIIPLVTPVKKFLKVSMEKSKYSRFHSTVRLIGMSDILQDVSDH
jgi:hypothetical protein